MKSVFGKKITCKTVYLKLSFPSSGIFLYGKYVSTLYLCKVSEAGVCTEGTLNPSASWPGIKEYFLACERD